MASNNKPKYQSVTVMGITANVCAENLDDYELFEKVAEYDNSPVSFVLMLKALLGNDYERVVKELKGDADRLSLERIGEYFSELTKAIGTLKN